VEAFIRRKCNRAKGRQPESNKTTDASHERRTSKAVGRYGEVKREWGGMGGGGGGGKGKGGSKRKPLLRVLG